MEGRRGFGADAWIGWFLIAIGLATPCIATAGDAEILYFESIRSLTPDRDTVLRKRSVPQLRELRFDAYGRRFELELDANSALAELQSKAGASSLQLYRGRLNNIAGSWVRLAVKGASMQGVIWDGADLFVIEPAAQVQDALTRSLNVEKNATVIFRLADVRIDPNEASCALDDAVQPRDGQKEYESLLLELKRAPAVMQAAGANVRLQVSALGDAAFLQRYANKADARDAILTRLNIVDGVFSAQLGVEIQVPTVIVNDAQNDPLPADEVAPNALLEKLGWVRKYTPELHSKGLTHLFTGRDLEGTTVGIAYLNALCDARYGASLTEVRTHSVWRDALIAAHEIGHNFGASHDGDGSCKSTPEDEYLMAASVSGSDRFSQCSLDIMRSRSRAARCITRLPDADLAIAGDLGVAHKPVSQPFEWTLEVANVGGVAAERARVEILVPPVVLVDDAYVVGGSCTSGAGMILCQLGDIPGGALRTVTLTLRSDVVGSSSIHARVSSADDSSLLNNQGGGSLLFEPEADLEIILQAPPSAAIADLIEVVFSVANHAAIDAANIDVRIDLPGGFSASDASFPNGECVVTMTSVQCTLSSLSGGAAASGALTLSGSAAGPATLVARVTGAYVDPQSGNDVAQHMITINSAPSAVVQSESPAGAARGGGGAASLPFLLGLLGLVGVRLIRVQNAALSKIRRREFPRGTRGSRG